MHSEDPTLRIDPVRGAGKSEDLMHEEEAASTVTVEPTTHHSFPGAENVGECWTEVVASEGDLYSDSWTEVNCAVCRRYKNVVGSKKKRSKLPTGKSKRKTAPVESSDHPIAKMDSCPLVELSA